MQGEYAGANSSLMRRKCMWMVFISIAVLTCLLVYPMSMFLRRRSVLSSMKTQNAELPYANQLFQGQWERMHIPLLKSGYTPSHVAVSAKLLANVRCVNYTMGQPWPPLPSSLNFVGKWDPHMRSFHDDWRPLKEPGLPKRKNSSHLGIEDIRLHPGGGFSGGTREYCTYIDAHRIVYGREYPDVSDLIVLKPPNEEHSVEKNWIFLNNSVFAYTWHPLTLCTLDKYDGRTVEMSRQETPSYFKETRGSAPPVSYGGYLLVLTHQRCESSVGVKYTHWWNIIKESDMQLVARTPMFQFFESDKPQGLMQYCLSCLLYEGMHGAEVQAFVNQRDETLHLFRCHIDAIFRSAKSLDAFDERDAILCDPAHKHRYPKYRPSEN